MKIIIDTREQQPWSFPREFAETVRAKLNLGDYALLGDITFSIERKNLNDFVNTITSNYNDLVGKIECMKAKQFPAIVIIVEGDFSQIISHDYSHPNASPKFVIKQIALLTMMGVSILFASTPVMAAGLAYSIFKRRENAIENE